MNLSATTVAVTASLALVATSACAGQPHIATAPHTVAAPAAADGAATFGYREGAPFVRPERLDFVNANGTPRVHTDEDYDRFWREVAPLLREWGSDPRLAINPAYVAALIAKESGFEPFATSWTPANGYPQLTHIADADLVEMARSPAFRWMLPELEAWPRHPLVHRPDAAKEVTDSLVLAGTIHGGNEYFFDPVRATRGAFFWLRLLAEVWTSDDFPGRYGSFAREQLSGGEPLTDEQLLELVTVSYNRGYTYVYDLIQTHGRDWKAYVNEEAADHLERITAYTRLFEGI